MDLKQKLKEKFKQIYGEKYRLLAIQLNGFSHSVFYDEGTYNSRIHTERFSAYAPEQKWDEKSQKLLGDIPHYMYQNNAKELLYVHPNKR